MAVYCDVYQEDATCESCQKLIEGDKYVIVHQSEPRGKSITSVYHTACYMSSTSQLNGRGE